MRGGVAVVVVGVVVLMAAALAAPSPEQETGLWLSPHLHPCAALRRVSR